VINDEDRKWRSSEWIMSALDAVLLVRLGIVRGCGKGDEGLRTQSQGDIAATRFGAAAIRSATWG
jgi:hypothetical protein